MVPNPLMALCVSRYGSGHATAPTSGPSLGCCVNMPIRPLVDRLHRPVEFIANLAIIAVAILGCALLTKQLRSAPVPPRPQAAVRPAERTAPEVGARVSVEGIDWSR